MGSIFKCTSHHFGCDTIREWREHCEELEHTYVGNTACFNCGAGIKLNHTVKVQKNNPVPQLLCEECKTS